jgi:hypothetical protein
VIWSVSASRAFDRCQRQFYFSQVMAWHKTKDPLRQRAYSLKQIQQLAWWPGKVVHRAIQHWVLPEIERGQWPEPGQVISQAQDLARQQFLFSQAGNYRTTSKTDAGDQYCVLAPHYFEEPIEPDVLDKALTTIDKALRNLLTSQQTRDFLIGRQLYWWEYRLHFKVEGATVRAVPDLLMLSDSGMGLDVVDWKVATTASSYHSQVAIYALAAQKTGWLADYAHTRLTGYVANLLEPEPAVALKDPYVVDEHILATTIDTIYESIERIRALTGDRKYDQHDIGRFEYARSAGTCALCNWHELCVELGDGSPAESLSNIKSRPTQLELPLG